MEILICDGVLQVNNLPSFNVGNHNQAIEIITAAVQNADLTGVTHEMLSDLYFGSEHVVTNRADEGVIETPTFVATFMVSLAHQRWHSTNKETSRPNGELHWLDPCCGAGVFPRAVIDFHIDKLGAKEISDIPRITIVDLNLLGLTSTLFSIKLALERKGLDFSEYIKSQ